MGTGLYGITAFNATKDLTEIISCRGNYVKNHLAITWLPITEPVEIDNAINWLRKHSRGLLVKNMIKNK